jgi:hypothetical protein
MTPLRAQEDAARIVSTLGLQAGRRSLLFGAAAVAWAGLLRGAHDVREEAVASTRSSSALFLPAVGYSRSDVSTLAAEDAGSRRSARPGGSVLRFETGS